MNRSKDFGWVGVSAGRLLRENEFAVYHDFKSTAAAGNQRDLLDPVAFADGRLEFGNEGFRQTGGARRVVSFHAEFDRDSHGPIEPRSWPQYAPSDLKIALGVFHMILMSVQKPMSSR